MLGGAKHDSSQGYEDLDRKRNEYRRALQDCSFDPTIEEFESVHGAMLSSSTMSGWSSLAVQSRPYQMNPAGEQGLFDGPDTDLELRSFEHDALEDKDDPFQCELAEETKQEPLLRDLRNDMSAQQEYAERARTMRYLDLEGPNEQEIDDDFINSRVHTIPSNYQTHEAELEPHNFGKSEFRARMEEADQRAARGAESVLGRSSYGNFGV